MVVMTAEALPTKLSEAVKIPSYNLSLSEGMKMDEDALSDDEEDAHSIVTEASQLLGSETTPEDLHIRLAKILGSSAVATQTTLSIPKDFAMLYDNPMGTHAVQLALYEKLQKQRQIRKRRGSVTKPDKRRRSLVKAGFDPVQLLKKRAIHFAKNAQGQTSTLTCEIHPVFRAENFHGCPDGVYDQLKPALRLATLMLTHRASSQYWHTLWFGRRQYCEDTSRQKQKPCFRIKEDVNWSSNYGRIFSNVLLEHASCVHFFFHSSPLQAQHVHASLQWVKDTKNLLPLHHSHDYDTFTRGRICLHTDFFTTAKRNSLLTHPDPAALLRSHFWLATSICHEMAHYLEWARRHVLKDHVHEAFWYEDDWNEAGEAWEKKMFGGRIEPIASRADCVYGLATVNWPMIPLDEAEDPDSNVFWTLPMEFISQIQQQKTWDLLAAKENSENESTFFHIPRIGTRSRHLSSLDMTVWTDEAEPDLISDDLDNVDTVLKRTCNGRIVKRTRDKKRMGLMVKTKKAAKLRALQASESIAPRRLRSFSVRGKLKPDKKKSVEFTLSPEKEERMQE